MAESVRGLEFAPFAELSLNPEFGSHHDIYQSALAPNIVIRDIWGPGSRYHPEDVDQVIGWKKMIDYLGEQYGITTPGHQPVMTAEGPMVVTSFVMGDVLSEAILESHQAREAADDLLVRHVQTIEDLYDHGGYSYGDIYGMYQYMINEHGNALLVDLDLGGWFFPRAGHEDEAAQIEVFNHLLLVAQDVATLAAMDGGSSAKEKILAFTSRTKSQYPTIRKAKRVIKEGVNKADNKLIHSFAIDEEDGGWIDFWERQPIGNMLNLGKHERMLRNEKGA